MKIYLPQQKKLSRTIDASSCACNQASWQTLLSSGPIQRKVNASVVNKWAEKNNPTIDLNSGSLTDMVETVKLDDDNIEVSISEHASNHFVNRHTYKEFSFKDENIKTLNSFWEKDATQAQVNERAKKVIEGLETPIKETINSEAGGGVVQSDNEVVGGVQVGYLIRLEADLDSADYEVNPLRYEKGTGTLEMFYPEGEKYDNYSQDDLREIRRKLQGPPHNKSLKL